MKVKCYFFNQILFILVMISFPSVQGQAETINCTPITSLPYTISTQGVYCLKENLATSMVEGNAIEIATNNVVLDLNGFKLGGLGAGPGTWATGIYADQRQNIVIRNGTVRGFFHGIFLGDYGSMTTSQGHLIEDVRADMNTSVGIWVRGQGNIIRNNQIVGTGGSSVSTDFSCGITVEGPGNRVINNDVYETKEQGNGPSGALGIIVNWGKSSVVENNRVGNQDLGTLETYGIFIDNSSDNTFVVNNRITTMTYGIFYYFGTGKYRDNMTRNVTTPFSNGTDAGNNN